MESMFHSKTNENIQTQLERLAFQKGDDKEKERAALQRGDVQLMTCARRQRGATGCDQRQMQPAADATSSNEMQQAATRCNKQQRDAPSGNAASFHAQHACRMKRNALLSGLPPKRG
jgi:hypothetical protein